MTTAPDVTTNLHDALRTGITERPADVLLLSGGVDSSLLAAMAAEHLPTTPVAITVSLDLPPGTPCPVHGADLAVPCNSDHGAARDVVTWLGLRWQPVRISPQVALDGLLDLCLALQSFDPGNLNTVALYFGALRAVRFGAQRIWTGDDADSLFGGYRFLAHEQDWGGYLAARIPTLRPPFTDVAGITGATPVFPWLHPDVTAVARTLPRREVIAAMPVTQRPVPPGFVDQFDERMMDATHRPWGKLPVRRVAARYLPDEIAWRPKTDLQFGSGMCALEAELARRITPDDAARLDATGMRFFNDAHRGLYLRYRDAGGEVPKPQPGEYACVNCGGGVSEGRTHCPTCGAWPATQARPEGTVPVTRVSVTAPPSHASSSRPEDLSQCRNAASACSQPSDDTDG